jgi:AcrR family transcriptional regulator
MTNRGGTQDVQETEPTGKAATQERILAAATALFIEQGYEQTTVQEVADRAGVSRATVFWHFSEKAALFRESFSRLLQPFRASLERDLSDLEPAKRLEEQMAASDRFAREHRDEVGAFVRWAVESPAFREHVITALFDLNQRFAGVLTQTVADLAPRGYDPKLLAGGIMLAFDANLLLSLFDLSPRGMDERGAAVAELTRLVQALAGPSDGA